MEYYSLQAVFAGADRADRPYDLDSKTHVLRQSLLRQKRALEAEQKTAPGPLSVTELAELKAALAKNEGTPEEKSVVKKTLGLDLSNLTDDLRKRYKIKDSVKGVVITAVEDGSAAADKRLAPGDVIVELGQEPVSNAADVQKKIDQFKKDGRKSALLLIANAEGEVRFVALALQ